MSFFALYSHNTSLGRPGCLAGTNSILISIGRIYFHQDRFDDATACLEEALAIKIEFLPANHMSLAETQHLLGSLYINTDGFVRAIPLLKSALVGYKGSREVEILKSDVLDLLGKAYMKTGENAHAILSYEHSLKMKKVVVGKDCVACANVLMEIGKLKSLSDDIAGALVAFKEGDFFSFHCCIIIT